MSFTSIGSVIKISISDINKSIEFYRNVLGFSLDPRYSILKNPKEISYIQMNFNNGGNHSVAIGLYNDIKEPFNPIPENGTVPSFIVEDIESTLKLFQEKKVVIDKVDGEFIIENTSDEGFVDKFFFFRDPDNNSLVIRENL
ncbi:VOC family protein [Algoriphagus sp.]|uniref:VOC family protein n=1 Tax=Algoriphagus sp. TaxID=1872435 RepID=UPI0025CCAA3E|nr:VOC family protein [Algoriphagus sp.]